MTLDRKIDFAIKLLRSIPQDGPIELSYSGGKDSDVILELAKMAGNSISPIEALEKFKCFRLGARIWDLIHKDGYIIYKEMVKDSKTGKRYAQYSM